MSQSYDAVVVGAGIAGLGIAGLLAKSGKKVLLVERNRNVGGRAATFRKDGIVRSIGQHAAVRGQKYDKLLDRLGVQGQRETFGDLQIYFEGEFKSLFEIMPQVLGDCMDDAMKFMEVVNGDLDLDELDDLPADEWVRRYISNETHLEMIQMATTIMTTIPRLGEMAASTVVETQQMLMRTMDTWLAGNGMSEFLDGAADRIRHYGGEVWTNAPVESILVDAENRVTGVLVGENIVEDIEGEFGEIRRVDAPLVVSAIPIWELFRMIPEEKFPGDFVKMAWNVSERTANLGVAAALPKAVYEGRGLIMLEYPSVGYPGTIFMPTNVCPNLAPEGVQLFEASIICNYDIGRDKAKKHHMLDMLKKDLQSFFPDWDKDALWASNYFHYEEPKRTAGRAGRHRPGVKAPGIEGLYFCGDSVASRALPGMECAADSAMICAEAILGELP